MGHDAAGGPGQAQTLFAAGDLAGAAHSADAAASAWSSAADIGRGRVAILGVGALAVAVALVLVGLWLRGRRRGDSDVAVAAVAAESAGPSWVPVETRPVAVSGPGAEAASGQDSYATLAASPDPVEGTEAGQPAGRGAEPD